MESNKVYPMKVVYSGQQDQVPPSNSMKNEIQYVDAKVALVNHSKQVHQHQGLPVKDEDVSQVQLKRNLSLFGATSLVVGAIIGSGIFMLPNIIYLESGETPFISIILWIVGAMVALGGSICYAELATSITVSGGEQAFLTTMYGPLLGFLFVWTNTLIMNPGGNAAIALFCSEYIVVQINRGWAMNVTDLDALLKSQSEYIQASIAIIILFIASLVNALSTEYGNKMNELFSSVKVFGIGLICCIGVYYLSMGEWQQFEVSFISEKTTFQGAANALTLSMWAYGGWSFLSWVTEEIKNPDRNIPLSLFLGIGIVCIVYSLFNVALFFGPLLDHGAITPLILRYARNAWGGWGWFIATFCILTSTYGAEASNTISTTRFYHACARDGHLPKALSLCWAKQATPVVAIVFNFVSTSIFILAGKRAGNVISMVTYCQWMFFLAVFIGLIKLRYTQPTLRRPFKAPLVVPVFTIIMSLVMVFSPFLDSSVDDYWNDVGLKYGTVTIAIITGIPFYYLCACPRTRLKVFEKISNMITKGIRATGLE